MKRKFKAKKDPDIRWNVLKILAINGPRNRGQIERDAKDPNMKKLGIKPFAQFSSVQVACNYLFRKNCIEVVKATKWKTGHKCKTYALTLDGLLELFDRDGHLKNMDKIAKHYCNLLPGILGKWDYFVNQGIADVVENILSGIASPNLEIGKRKYGLFDEYISEAPDEKYIRHTIYQRFFICAFHIYDMMRGGIEKSGIEKDPAFPSYHYLRVADAIAKDEQLFTLAFASNEIARGDLLKMMDDVEIRKKQLIKACKRAGLPKIEVSWEDAPKIIDKIEKQMVASASKAL